MPSRDDRRSAAPWAVPTSSTPRSSRRRFLLQSTAVLASLASPLPGRVLAAAAPIAEGNPGNPNGTAQRPYIADYSLIVGVGQSNLEGDQGAWAGASPPMFGNVMLGEGTRPVVSNPLAPDVEFFQPVGNSDITPLISANQNHLDGSVVTIAQGGFGSVTGVKFGGPSKGTMTLTDPTGTMVLPENGTLKSTAVGGPGQPKFDLTKVFTPGMGLWISGMTGSPAAQSLNQNGVLRIATVAPLSLTLAGTDGFGYVGPAESPINLNVSNNFAIYGEDPMVTQVNDYAALASAAGTLPAGKGFGVINTSIGGQPIAALEPGATPDQYNRAIDGVTRFVAAAAALGKTAYVAIDLYEQGNGDLFNNKDTTFDAYTAGLFAIYSGHRADYPAITGQSRPPIFMISQTSGFDLSGNDYGDDAVVMAQLEFGTSGLYPDAYCVGPTYYAPSQGLHETPNGQRWKGAMRGKIAYRILALNEGWLPLYPIGATYLGRQVQITFHVPVGSLQFRPSFNLCTPTVYPDAGFQATDNAGLNPVTSVAIMPGGKSVLLTCARAFVSAPRVQYADAANHNGLGNLYDSDPAVSSEIFTYTPFAGQPPIEDIPAFTDTVLTGKTFPSPVGQPYALFNPCCIFNIAATPG